MSKEEFLASRHVQNLLVKYGCPTLLLKPQKPHQLLSALQSKFGGTPNLNGFDTYPLCTSCQHPLNFVLQVYKNDVSALAYFPAEKNLLQLFRCSNSNCTYNDYELYDVPTYHFYHKYNGEPLKTLDKPERIIDKYDEVIHECELRPTEILEMPNSDDYGEVGNTEFDKIHRLFGVEYVDYYEETYYAKPGTKFGGYPAFTQSPNYPLCKHCDKPKEFFFQLSSEDIEEGIFFPPPPDRWSAHGIMIGDVGNIYYYVCKPCGEQSIESNWDCS